MNVVTGKDFWIGVVAAVVALYGLQMMRARKAQA